LRTIPIVAVTAHHEEEMREGAQASGCTAYVTKPIDFDWLDDSD
jgi:CheY-like chemotaxis protein